MSEVGGLMPYEDSRAQQEEERFPLLVWQELSWRAVTALCKETVTAQAMKSRYSPNSQFLQRALFATALTTFFFPL